MQPVAVRVGQAIAWVQGVQAVPHLKAVRQAVPIRVGPAWVGAPGGFVGVAQAIAIGIDEDVRHRAHDRPAAIGVEAYPPTVDLGRRAVGVHNKPRRVVVADDEFCRAVEANGGGGTIEEAESRGSHSG